MNHLMIFVVHETQISHLKFRDTFENPIEYGVHLVMASKSHTLHLKCASYLDVIEADDASDDPPDFTINDKNCTQIDKQLGKFYM